MDPLQGELQAVEVLLQVQAQVLAQAAAALVPALGAHNPTFSQLLAAKCPSMPACMSLAPPPQAKVRDAVAALADVVAVDNASTAPPLPMHEQVWPKTMNGVTLPQASSSGAPLALNAEVHSLLVATCPTAKVARRMLFGRVNTLTAATLTLFDPKFLPRAIAGHVALTLGALVRAPCHGINAP